MKGLPNLFKAPFLKHLKAFISLQMKLSICKLQVPFFFHP